MSQSCFRCQRTLDLPGQVAFCPYCGQPLSVTDADPDRTTAPTAPSASAPATESVPETLGDYRLLRHLGQGGMGVVYEGEHVVTGHRVAVKLIDVEAAPADALERFRQEGRLASAISHPRSVFVYAADQDAGRPFIVLELMPGQTLDDLVRQRGPLSVGEAISHALDLIEGLEQVHALGVIHRDVKPSNCFLDHDGRVKVGDFGLARSLHPDARLTRTGTFVGTPLYASPEQIKGQPLDARADVYSVCATLFFLLTGRAPHDYGERDSLALMARVVSEDAPSVRSLRPDVPFGLERILARGLSRDRERRQADLDVLRTELSAFRQTLPGGRLVGTRLAAYLTDWLVLTPVTLLIMSARGIEPSTSMPDLSVYALTTFLFLSYFAVPEGLLGYTLGKWLFGLRVRLRGDVEPPGLLRATIRYLIWIALTSWSGTFALLLPGPEYLPLAVALCYTLWFTGAGVLMCTMQKSNGYSCLHDLLTGTLVVGLADRQRSARFPSRAEPGPPAPAAAEERIGPFRVLGEVWRRADERVLRAIDPSLDRPVWLWLRPSTCPDLPAARRETPHGSRPRWLTHGEHQGQRWDAFLVPTGAPLVEAVAVAGKRSWEQARPILLELATELRRADDVAEGYRLSQVWLSPEGRVVLIDVPLGGAATVPTREELLAGAAVVLLEGKPPEPARTRLPRAVMPTHVREVLGGLPRFGGTLDAGGFHERLAATQDSPTRLSQAGRLLHLGMLMLAQFVCCIGGFFIPALCVGFAVTGVLGVEAHYGRTFLARHDRECAALAAPVVAPTANPLERLLPALVLQQYSRPQQRERFETALVRLEAVEQARFARLLPATQQGVRQGRESAEQHDFGRSPQENIKRWHDRWRWRFADATEFVWRAEMLERQSGSAKEELPIVSALMAVPVAVCVLAALITRRGVRSMLLGIDVVRRDGAPGGRLRCAWRALVAWVPFVGVLMLANWLEETYWARWTPAGGDAWLLSLANVAWLGVIGVPLLLVALLLWTPARGLHDRLAGTWLVPR